MPIGNKAKSHFFRIIHAEGIDLSAIHFRAYPPQNTIPSCAKGVLERQRERGRERESECDEDLVLLDTM